MPLVNDIKALNPVYNKWYMDDGGIIGDVELLQKVWDLLLTGPALGLHLNPSECEWSWLDPACKDACPIRLAGVSEENQVKLVPHEHIQMLGVPVRLFKVRGRQVAGSLARNCQSTCGVRGHSSLRVICCGELQHRSRSAFYAHYTACTVKRTRCQV